MGAVLALAVALPLGVGVGMSMGVVVAVALPLAEVLALGKAVALLAVGAEAMPLVLGRAVGGKARVEAPMRWWVRFFPPLFLELPLQLWVLCCLTPEQCSHTFWYTSLSWWPWFLTSSA
jgi:hypothetical protein